MTRGPSNDSFVATLWGLRGSSTTRHRRARGLGAKPRRRRDRRRRRQRRRRRPPRPRRPDRGQPRRAARPETNGVDDDGNGYVDDWQGWDFVTDDNEPQDDDGHGTHVAGTIAARPTTTARRRRRRARGARSCRCARSTTSGSGWTSDIAEAFDYAGDLGVRVVNAWLGGGARPRSQNAIPSHPNTLYVVAAGNDNTDNDDPSDGPVRAARGQHPVRRRLRHRRRRARRRSPTTARRPSICSRRARSILSTDISGPATRT